MVCSSDGDGYRTESSSIRYRQLECEIDTTSMFDVRCVRGTACKKGVGDIEEETKVCLCARWYTL